MRHFTMLAACTIAGLTVVASTTLPATAAVTPRTTAASVTTLTATNAELLTAAKKRVLFGHQSVGANIIEGMGTLYRARGVTSPVYRSWSNSLPSTGRYFADAYIGANGDPLSKIRAFVALMRGGAGTRVNVAAMKLCFVDVTAGTNVTSLFASYRVSMANLHTRYPKVALLYLTVPLTTDSPADNVKRQRFNALMRTNYASTGRLFDLAALESTKPTGARVTGLYNGARYYAMFAGYSSDGGHLNAAGERRLADAFMRLIARAIP
ncbi:MAG: hypothetical protein WCP26_12885 [Actinomycetes bacterium]